MSSWHAKERDALSSVVSFWKVRRDAGKEIGSRKGKFT